MDTKINLTIFLKEHNFLRILTVISAPSVLSTRTFNLHLKYTIYVNDAENETPCWQADDVTTCICSQRKLHIET